MSTRNVDSYSSFGTWFSDFLKAVKQLIADFEGYAFLLCNPLHNGGKLMIWHFFDLFGYEFILGLMAVKLQHVWCVVMGDLRWMVKMNSCCSG